MVLLTPHRSHGTAAAFTLGPLPTGTAQALLSIQR
jgi:hypothetical protein